MATTPVVKVPKFHNWALGGDRAENGTDYALLPQKELDKNYPVDPDSRKGRGVGHVLTTEFNPDEKGCATDGKQRGRPEQGSYLQCTEVCVGDVFGMATIPRYSLFHGLFWRLRVPIHGLKLKMGIRGCARSVTPPIPNPDFDPEQPPSHDNPELISAPVCPTDMNIVLVEEFDAGCGFDAAGCLLEDCYYPNGYVFTKDKCPIYFDQNDMFVIEILEAPEDFDLSCLDLELAPHICWMCTGGAGFSKAELYDFGPQPKTKVV